MKNCQTRIFNNKFVINNKNKSKIIINNKQYNLVEKINNENKNKIFKIKLKLLDIFVNIDSMFKDCEMLYSLQDISKLNLIGI